MKHSRTVLIFLGLLIMLLSADFMWAQNDLKVYGYFSNRVEKIFDVPTYEDGEIEGESEDFEWQSPYFNIMFQYSLSNKIRTFINLNGGDGLNLKSLEVRNAWGEYSFGSKLKVRVGKSYKKFGLYNEILDAVPTYYAIEPPQFLNNDHPIGQLYPRTTPLLLHGVLDAGVGTLSYGLSVDKGLSEAYQDAFPFSADLNYSFENPLGSTKIGFAAYTTAGTVSAEEEGEEHEGDEEGEDEEGEEHEGVEFGGEEDEEGFEIGSGIMPWMKSDNFNVLGGYLEHRIGDLTLQAGYWKSNHEAERDIEKLEGLLEGVQNEQHLNRFLEEPEEGIEDDNIIEDVDYSIETWYVRAGYSFYTEIGEVGPYVQWDYYKNPELVALRRLDEEHNGMPDNGEFQLATIGLLYRPEPNVAIKLDVSSHIYDFFGESKSYPEFRLDFSFVFGQ